MTYEWPMVRVDIHKTYVVDEIKNTVRTRWWQEYPFIERVGVHKITTHKFGTVVERKLRLENREKKGETDKEESKETTYGE